jgi:hypothetical protein
MTPVAWIFLENVSGIFFIELTNLQLPLTNNGKVNKAILPQPSDANHLLSETIPTALVEPQTMDEVIMLSLWKAALGLNSISIYDNFFDLGGHSLTVTQLLSAIYDR